jgi:protein TonB
MFEPLYVRPRWYRPILSEGTVASLAVHAVAYVALLASGGTPASVAKQVTEGIVFLAPVPSRTAGPVAVVEQLRFVDVPNAVTALAPDNSELHVDSKLADATLHPEETNIGPPVESVATIFETPAESVYFAEQVDSPAAYDEHSAAPAYPDSLQRLGIEGSVMAQFVVDTSGRVEMESVRLLESTNLRFTESVLSALPRMLFRPAVLNGRKARQVVEVPFRFRVVITKDTVRKRDTLRARPPR